MLGVNHEILPAAPQLEEIEHGVERTLGHEPGCERAIRFIEIATRKPVASVHARVGVVESQPQKVWRVQAHAAARLGRAIHACARVVQQQERLEFGAGHRPLDRAYALSQVESFRLHDGSIGPGFGRSQQTRHAAAQVGRAGQVRLGVRVVSAQGKDAGQSRHRAQDICRVRRLEIHPRSELEPHAHLRNCRTTRARQSLSAV